MPGLKPTASDHIYRHIYVYVDVCVCMYVYGVHLLVWIIN